MSIFKKAKEMTIPDAALDTESWISDETLAEIFLGPDMTAELNAQIQVEQPITAPNFKYADDTSDDHKTFSYDRSLGDAA